MNFFDIIIAAIQFLVGLGVLLYGVHILKGGLEKSFGVPLRKKLEKFSDKPLKSAVFGFGVTTALQSSTASTMMVLGFTSAGVLTLAQATGMLAGGVIGSTMNTLLLSFSFIKVTDILMLGVFVGTIMYLFAKSQKVKDVGVILVGFGLMFLSLYLMSQSTSALRKIDGFDTFLASVTNPALLLFIGIIFTALIQSSFGTSAILITLVSSGVISIQSAAFVQFGAVIGTASTSVLAAIGGNTDTKRVTLINIIIRASGLIVMIPLTILVPWISWTVGLGVNPAFMVFLIDLAYATTCLCLSLPFTKLIVGISERVFKKKEIRIKSEIELLFGIDDNIKAMPSLALHSVQKSAVGLVEKSAFALQDVIDYAQKKESNKLFVSAVNKDEIKYQCSVLGNFINQLYSGLTEGEIKMAQNYQSILNECNRLTIVGTKMRLSYKEFLEKNIKDERRGLVNDILNELNNIADLCVKVVKGRAEGASDFKNDIISIFEADEKINATRAQLKKANVEKLKKTSGDNRIYYNVFYNLINHLDELSEVLTKIALTSV